MSHRCPSYRKIVVVVEDHVDVRRYLGLFGLHGYCRLVEASNGYEGKQAVKNCRPALVRSEISMPGANGFEMLREIRLLGGKMPVIAMAAYHSGTSAVAISNELDRIDKRRNSMVFGEVIAILEKA